MTTERDQRVEALIESAENELGMALADWQKDYLRITIADQGTVWVTSMPGRRGGFKLLEMAYKKVLDRQAKETEYDPTRPPA